MFLYIRNFVTIQQVVSREACMSRDFDIFMSKHLAGQWLLNSYAVFFNF